MTPFTVVLITTPKSASQRLAQALLKRRLAACVNIMPAIRSFYWWQGKIQADSESLLLVKTRKSLYKKLQTFVRSHHPYSVPEIIRLDIAAGHKPYLSWLKKETR